MIELGLTNLRPLARPPKVCVPRPQIYGIDVTAVDETQHLPATRYEDAMKAEIEKRAAECRE